MERNYKILAQNIKSRLNPDDLLFEKSFRDELSTISYNKILVYVRTAMKGVPPEYTKKSKDAGERVKGHLSKELQNVKYKYQGSVMTNTHIKGISDIDLLVICDKFYNWDSLKVNSILNDYSQKNKFSLNQVEMLERETRVSNYTGDSLQDLRSNRLDSERILDSIYSICDISKPKAIKIKNLDLNREVDTVIANWYDSTFSIINGKGDNRGIQVYNKDENSKGPVGYPFLSITRITSRNSFTNGRLNKMIRFLKNVKADSDFDIKLSSFDINAICYDISTSKYQNSSFYELVPIIYSQLNSLTTGSTHSDILKSVDESEYIFRYDSQKLQNLKLLMNEVEGILVDLSKSVVYA
ncbi:hypothetical protein [Hwangdonia sp.]|uniref:hypothetical protein n=1 Tax=Hwangdonia sp. TaxID=1883432 RepID=UPI003AB68500